MSAVAHSAVDAKRRYAQYLAGIMRPRQSAMVSDLRQEFSDAKIVDATVACGGAPPSIESLAFAGIPMRVRGVDNAVVDASLIGPIPFHATPHWVRGEEGFFPFVSALDRPATVAVTMAAGSVTLANCTLIGISDFFTVVSSAVAGNVFRCDLQPLVQTPGGIVTVIDWALQTENGEFMVLDSSTVAVFFVWSAPVGPWAGKPVWYEALTYALADLGVENTQSQEESLTAMISRLHGNPNLTYNTLGGNAYCQWTPHYSASNPFELTTFLRVAHGLVKGGKERHPGGFEIIKPPPTLACYDMAASLSLFANIVGIPAMPYFMGIDFDGKWKIGLGLIAKPVKVLGLPKRAVQEDFNTHVCVTCGGRLYDACIFLEGGSLIANFDVDTYLDTIVAEKRRIPTLKANAGPVDLVANLDG